MTEAKGNDQTDVFCFLENQPLSGLDKFLSNLQNTFS